MSEPRSFRQSRFERPPGACEILLVRHGESAPAVEGESFPLVNGHGDPPLAPDGVVQAEQAADRLLATREQISAVYVSTLQRTRQTADPLLSVLGLDATVEPDLREVGLGEFEGGELRRRIADADPIALEMNALQRWDVIPNAEPLELFQARVRRGISRIAAAHPDQVVAAFVHGGVIGEVINLATGATGFAFTGAANGSISHIVVERDTWMVQCYNDTSHLSPTFSAAASIG